MVKLNVLQIDLSDVLAVVRDITYPITKQELVEEARSQGASEEILDSLERLQDQTFESVDQLKESLESLKKSGQEAGQQMGQEDMGQSGDQNK